jgi:hypothetical protein
MLHGVTVTQAQVQSKDEICGEQSSTMEGVFPSTRFSYTNNDPITTHHSIWDVGQTQPASRL